MTELSGKRVMVVGMGVSGAAAARLLASRGAHLVMTDKRTELKREAFPEGDLRLGGEDPRWLKGIDLVVTSPGVPRESALLREAASARIPIWGEIELASRFIAAPIAAITGTNGKSTVTVMIGEMLRAAGMKVFVGGNLGTPLADAVGAACDVAVLEVSSYQLEWIEKFRPHVGVHLNLTDDHLDRYRDLDDYGSAKARLFENQNVDDWAILNRDDPNVWKLRKDIRSRVMSFGFSSSQEGAALSVEDRAIVFDDGAHRCAVDIRDFALPGRHNLANVMAAAGAAFTFSDRADIFAKTLARFQSLHHRIEVVHRARGITFVDDSKGTNVGAVIEALDAFPAPIILIAGGMDKGGGYQPLRAPLAQKVKLAILIGAAREKMCAALQGATEIEVVETLKEAVEVAVRSARAGDTVMLSPACSSFDQFKDYAERGDLFKELVRSI